jgi:ABC-2 type transport system ATP-binding protein
MNAGKLAALGTTRELKQVFAGRPILEVQAPSAMAAMRALEAMPEVEKTSLFGTAVHAVLRSADTTAERVTGQLRTAGVAATSVAPVEPSLEDVFLDLVERAGA